MVFNPSSMDRLSHVIMGSWQAGAWLVISVSAYYLIKKKHQQFAKSSIKIALIVATIASVFQLVTGHSGAVGVAENQPAKMAAMEGHYEESAPASMYLFGWVNDNNQEVRFGIEVPGMLSWLITGDANATIKGLRSFTPENRPPVNIVFQTYHLMVSIGLLLILLSFLGIYYWWRGTLFDKKWLLWIFVFAVLLPHVANQVGWIAAEVGRQPWIVHGLLRTSEGLSEAVTGNMVLGSLIMFTLIYLLLFTVFVYILNEKIQHGPEMKENDSVVTGHRA